MTKKGIATIPQTVLLIDDQTYVLDLYKDILGEEYQILTALNGKDGLDLFHQNKIDVVVLDLQMEGMDGCEIGKKIRMMDPNVPIIVVTGHSTLERAEKSADLKVSGYLKKPFKPHLLKERISHALQDPLEKRIEDMLVINELSDREHNMHNTHIFKAIRFIRQNYYRPVTIESLVEHVCLSGEYIGRLFKKDVGVSISAYINSLRVNKAKDLLRLTDLTVSEISSKVGYHNLNYFFVLFQKHFGISPRQYRLSSR